MVISVIEGADHRAALETLAVVMVSMVVEALVPEQLPLEEIKMLEMIMDRVSSPILPFLGTAETTGAVETMAMREEWIIGLLQLPRGMGGIGVTITTMMMTSSLMIFWTMTIKMTTPPTMEDYWKDITHHRSVEQGRHHHPQSHHHCQHSYQP